MVIYTWYGGLPSCLLAHDISCSQANIFIDAEGHARLADFGLSIVGETTIGRMSSGSGTAGNPRYLAPERVAATQNMRRSTACDVYAFACVCLFVSFLLLR
jgi:serine/threonine protein kinase